MISQDVGCTRLFVGPVWNCQERKHKCLEALPSYGRVLFSGSQRPEMEMNFGVGMYGGVLPEKTSKDGKQVKDETKKEMIDDVVTTQNASTGSVMI